MNEKSLDQILDCLGRIGLNKTLMLRRLRGWVSSLGLHVQLKDDWKRVIAGGMWRPCIDATAQEDGTWHVSKFDRAAWDKRFAHLLGPTLEISEFIAQFGDEGGLHGEPERVYWNTILHYRSTGEWNGLETTREVGQASMAGRENEKFKQLALQAHNKMVPLIAKLEKQIADNPRARIRDERTRRQLRELYSELLDLGFTDTPFPLGDNSMVDQALQDLYRRYRSLMLMLGRHIKRTNSPPGGSYMRLGPAPSSGKDSTNAFCWACSTFSHCPMR